MSSPSDPDGTGEEDVVNKPTSSGKKRAARTKRGSGTASTTAKRLARKTTRKIPSRSLSCMLALCMILSMSLLGAGESGFTSRSSILLHTGASKRIFFNQLKSNQNMLANYTNSSIVEKKCAVICRL